MLERFSFERTGLRRRWEDGLSTPSSRRARTVIGLAAGCPSLAGTGYAGVRGHTGGMESASLHDVAAYILANEGPTTAMKLQKLCFYAQAWHVVWEGRPLFAEEFEAWANGPVSPDLYRVHRGQFIVESDPLGDASKVVGTVKEDVDLVLSSYAKHTPYELSAAVHNEAPWKDARGDLPLGARGSTVISTAAMDEHYSSLVA